MASRTESEAGNLYGNVLDIKQECKCESSDEEMVRFTLLLRAFICTDTSELEHEILTLNVLLVIPGILLVVVLLFTAKVIQMLHLDGNV